MQKSAGFFLEEESLFFLLHGWAVERRGSELG